MIRTPVKPGSVFVLVPAPTGFAISLSNFCDSKVFPLNEYGAILLFLIIVELFNSTNFELLISALLFANFTVESLILLMKYKPSEKSEDSTTFSVTTVPAAETFFLSTFSGV